ncbi:helix-turn-helix domain-containing protein [Streptomyces sp. NPDC050433]|uniref:helix-turn-helix domain-containing protein n=1 Tax=unclassified Streptomyces TaxID=2593676 RepID=UPI00344312EA
MSRGYHTNWNVPPEHREDAEYRAAGRRMDFAQAVYERRAHLGWSAAELAERAGMAQEDIDRIEESGVDPTLELLERLAMALQSGARVDPSASPEFRFEGRAA